MTIAEKVITHAEFWELFDKDWKRQIELIDGHLVERPTSPFLHSLVVTQVIYHLNMAVMNKKIGYAVNNICPFELAKGMILRARVAFFKGIKIPEKMDFAPDIAVELMPVGHDFMPTKIEAYCRYGTKMVWVAHPEEKIIRVYQPAVDDGINFKTLTVEDVLDGGNVLPLFSVKVQDIFSNFETE